MKARGVKRGCVLMYPRQFEWLYLQRGLYCFYIEEGLTDDHRSPRIKVYLD